jgi:F0F1-type ATP synthase assembly protein I
MPRQREDSDLARYSGLGLQFAATVGAFAFAGHWLDGRWNAGPWFLISGVFTGFALGLYSLVKKVPSPTRKPRDPGGGTPPASP